MIIERPLPYSKLKLSVLSQEFLRSLLIIVAKAAHRSDELTMLDRDVAFHKAYTRASEALLGSLLNKAFKPAGKGESKERGRISSIARKAPRDIQ